MNTNVTWDPSDFDAKAEKLIQTMTQRRNIGVHAVATEIMRLSQREVPLDKGELAKSGHLQPDSPAPEIIVGYNKPYAAFQHEGVRKDGTHVVSHWQNGRKKKYLEDPIKNNLETLKGYLAAAIKGGGSGGSGSGATSISRISGVDQGEAGKGGTGGTFSSYGMSQWMKANA